MKIVITSLGTDLMSDVDNRFGRTRYFIEVDSGNNSTFKSHDNNQNLNAAQGAGIQAAQQVVEMGADALLTGHIGPKAFSILQAGNIKTYIGASGTVENAVHQFNNGQLECVSKADVEAHWV